MASKRACEYTEWPIGGEPSIFYHRSIAIDLMNWPINGIRKFIDDVFIDGGVDGGNVTDKNVNKWIAGCMTINHRQHVYSEKIGRTKAKPIFPTVPDSPGRYCVRNGLAWLGSVTHFNYKTLISFSRRLAEISIANCDALFTFRLRFVFGKYE